LADDILQEAFLRFLRAVPADLEMSEQNAYLYQIARRLLVDHWRRLSREQRWDWRAYVGKEPTMHRDLGFSSDLSKIFQTLKRQQKELLWLAYVEGFEHREIASVLGLREKSVRVLLFRARRKLADLLRGKGLGPEVRP
jgi:RNA polymerase sigma-70 factor (ECF subfamily)